MHECEAESKQIVKRFKGLNKKQKVVKESYSDQPRSPFRIFMEDFMKSCNNGKLINIDRKGFETWKKMSKEERQPYIIKAKEVNSAYVETLLQEIDDPLEVDEEADSATVEKFDLFSGDYFYKYNDNSDSFESCRGFESLNTWQWEMVKPWMEFTDTSH
ncbi:hypothetical protein JCGZ_03348 [Jatropha curcas]|uniref:HMG box domain-containing protein n=2 Tax=Jatropha curcas TaxID=180498 RepID=A0A067JCZ7_JATCU|nr:hypothetical protein JCGZ_03348 [Jatropha curcas]